MSKKFKRKTSIKSSILVLLLMAILLISSTYAWFTANQTVTISTLNVNVVAQNGLQISADGKEWKAVLSNEDIMPEDVLNATYGSNINQIPEALVPVSTIGEVVDGKMKMFKGNVTSDADPESPTYGKYVLSSTVSSESRGYVGDYIAFDVFLRVDADTDIVLASGSDVTAGTNDKGLKNAARVAFVTAADADVQDAGAAVSDIQAVVPSVPYIWEPNTNVHTSAAISHALSNYGMSGLTGSTVLSSYNGLKDVTTTPLLLDSTDEAVFSEVTPQYKTLENNAADTDVFTLKAGITKVRIYMWVEGQDIDCENTASGTDINFDIQFQVK